MISIAADMGTGKIFNRLKYVFKQTKSIGLSIDTMIFVLVLLFCNLHLFSKTSFHHLTFIPNAFVSGDWYRLLTFPFVHVSWYHFFLDAGAFLLLYTGLTEKKLLRKLSYVVSCGISSLMAAILFAPAIFSSGLCGLSGIAHGLMMISAFELIQTENSFKTGIIYLVIIGMKSLYEAMTGNVIFSFLHMGFCGSPIAICHAGGVVGGCVVYLTFLMKDRFNGLP